MRRSRLLAAAALLLQTLPLRAANLARAARPAPVAPVTSLPALPLGTSLPSLSVMPAPLAPSAPAPSLSPAAALVPAPALAPAAAAAGDGIAPAGPAAPAARSWLGDHEETLLHGTAEQQAALDAAIVSGEVALRHPGSEAQRRALGVIRGVTQDWTPRLLERETAVSTPGRLPLAPTLGAVLRRNGAELGEARRRAPLPIEKLVFTARLYATRWEPVFLRDRSAGEFLAKLSRRSLGRDRFIAEELAARIPGARADRAVAGNDRLRSGDVAGYTPSHLSEDGAPAAGWTWHSRAGERSFFFHNLAHEFWHSTDRGYMAGEKALTALFGAMGPGLATALIEGYTDLRARRTLETLRADGLDGASKAGRAYAAALRAEAGGRGDGAAWAAHQRKLRSHPYQPYVSLALAVEARPGGAAALEAFASRGDVLPLVAALGEGRLRDLAVALAPPPLELYGPHAHRAYRALGFPRRFEHALGDIASGRLTSQAFRRLKDRSMELTGRAAWALAAHGARPRAFRRLAALDAAARLWAGQDARSLADAAEDAASPRWADRLPSADRRSVLLYAVLPAALGVAASPFFGPLWAAAAALGGYWLADLYNAAWALLAPARRIEMLRARAARRPLEAGFSAIFWKRRAPAAASAAIPDVSRWNEEQAQAFLRRVTAPFEGRLAAAGFELMPMLRWDVDEPDLRVKWDGMFHNLILSKGFLATPGLTEDALTAAVAHELGHLLGAGPRLDYQRTTVEGEADYFGHGEGWRLLAAAGALGPDPGGPEREEARRWLARHGLSHRQLEDGSRALAAALRLRRAFSRGPVSLDTPDRGEAAATLEGYPSDQARLDTAAAAVLGRPRPRSWALPGDFPAP